MGKYDYPTDDLRQKDYAAYLSQKTMAQTYHLKLAEFKNKVDYHRELSDYHATEALKYEELYNELKKDNEQERQEQTDRS